MPELQRLRAAHSAALEKFERENRSYFSAFISDRGDDFFEDFERHLSDALAEQAAGAGAFYLLVDEHDAVIGRFNLFDIHDGTAHLGYRVAAGASGRGVATAAVKELCALAVQVLGLRSLRAAVSTSHVASQMVLLHNAFVAVATAAPSDIGGKAGTWYERDLASTCGPDTCVRR